MEGQCQKVLVEPQESTQLSGPPSEIDPNTMCTNCPLDCNATKL